jgi:hypothetical protein
MARPGFCPKTYTISPYEVLWPGPSGRPAVQFFKTLQSNTGGWDPVPAAWDGGWDFFYIEYSQTTAENANRMNDDSTKVQVAKRSNQQP